MARYIQDPKTGKLVPAHEYQREAAQTAYVQGDIESFKSPIDGSVITDRAQLRAHNARHGVTDSRDYSADYFKQKAGERQATLSSDTESARRERVETLNDAFSRVFS